MNSSFNYAKTLGGGSYSGLKQAILRPESTYKKCLREE